MRKAQELDLQGIYSVLLRKRTRTNDKTSRKLAAELRQTVTLSTGQNFQVG